MQPNTKAYGYLDFSVYAISVLVLLYNHVHCLVLLIISPISYFEGFPGENCDLMSQT